MVFDMLADGKINTQDAIGLLEALSLFHQGDDNVEISNFYNDDELVILETEHVH